ENILNETGYLRVDVRDFSFVVSNSADSPDLLSDRLDLGRSRFHPNQLLTFRGNIDLSRTRVGVSGSRLTRWHRGHGVFRLRSRGCFRSPGAVRWSVVKVGARGHGRYEQEREDEPSSPSLSRGNCRFRSLSIRFVKVFSHRSLPIGLVAESGSALCPRKAPTP